MAYIKLERAVGKIVKLESFKLKSSFKVLAYTLKIVKLESFVQHETFQLSDLSNYTWAENEWFEIFEPNISKISINTAGAKTDNFRRKIEINHKKTCVEF